MGKKTIEVCDNCGKENCDGKIYYATALGIGRKICIGSDGHEMKDGKLKVTRGHGNSFYCDLLPFNSDSLNICTIDNSFYLHSIHGCLYTTWVSNKNKEFSALLTQSFAKSFVKSCEDDSGLKLKTVPPWNYSSDDRN